MESTTRLARAALEIAATVHPHVGDELRRILRRATLLERELGDGHLNLAYDTDHDDITGWLRAERIPRPSEVATVLWALRGRLGSAAAGLDALLARGLSPRASLSTWAEADRGLEGLLPEQDGSPVERAPWIDLRHAPGRGFSYRGYVCVILKPTRACNLRCSYCHDWRAEPAVLPVSLEARLWRQLLAEGPYGAIDVVWHGGEPTLLRRRRILATIALQQAWRRPGQVVNNVLQTNGTTMTEELAEFFATLGFRAAVSLDGPLNVHDRSRVDVAGRGTFARAIRGFRLLRQAGVDPGVLLVVSQPVIAMGAEALYRFLQEEGISRVGLIPVRPAAGVVPNDPRTNDYLTHEAFIAFLLAFQQVRQTLPGPTVACRELDGALAATRGENAGFCELLGDCEGHFLSVDPDGTVSHCDKYVGDEGYVLGSLATDEVMGMLTGPRLGFIRARWAEERDALRGCRHFGRCQGWCPHERYAARSTGVDLPEGCCGLGPLFDALDATGATNA